MNKVMLALALVMVMIIPVVSAATFDNIKSFDAKASNYGKITVRNWFGLQKLAEYTLEENTDYCSKRCSASGTTVLHKDGVLFSDLEFIDNEGVSYNLDYEIYVDGELYHGQYLDRGTYEWEIKAEKDPEDSIDWVASAFGKRFSEWEYWNSWFDWEDTFDNSDINQTFWQNYSTCSTGGNPGVTCGHAHYEDTDRLFLYNWMTSTMGNSGYSWAYIRTQQDYNDGRDYILNISWEPWGNSAHRYLALTNYTGQRGTTTSTQTGSVWLCDDTYWDYPNAPYSLTLEIDGDIGNVSCYYPNGTFIRETDVSGLGADEEWRFEFIAVRGATSSFTYSTNLTHFSSRLDGPIVILNSPANASVAVDTDVTFNCSIDSLANLDNITVWHDDSGTFQIEDTFYLGENQSIWNESTYSTEGTWANDGGMRITPTLGDVDLLRVELDESIDTGTFRLMNAARTVTLFESAITSPLITITANQTLTNGTQYWLIVVAGNEHAYGTGNSFPRTDNGILWDLGLNPTTGSTDTANGGYEVLNITFIEDTSETTYEHIFEDTMTSTTVNWNCEACDVNNTCYSGANNNTFDVGAQFNTRTFNATTFETAGETFSANVTVDDSFSTVDAFIWYNGTRYDASETASGSDYILSYTFGGIPTLVTENTEETRNFNWELILDSTTSFNDTVQTQTIQPINLTQCDTGNFINISALDEETLGGVSITLETVSPFNFYEGTGDGSVVRTFTYDNNTHNALYEFCFGPDRVVNLDGTMVYQNDSYPQREYDFTASYPNGTTNETILYLLSSSDGIYSTFQVLSPADQPIEGVSATVERQFSGVWTQIDAGTTGGDGGVTFWVNPNYQHRFTFSATGYDDVVETITPTQTQYTIIMGSGAVVNESYDYNRGIWYEILPAGQDLLNGTAYDFSFEISSNYWDLDSYGFILTNGTDSIGSSSGSTGVGSTLTLNRNTGENNTIHMNYYWVIDGNYTNGTTMWYVEYDSGRGISQFITHLLQYTDDGIFGLNTWALTFIVFIIIFAIVGFATYTFGITSVGPIAALLFGLVFLFDVVLGLLPTFGAGPFAGIQGLATVLTGIILLMLYGIRESMR